MPVAADTAVEALLQAVNDAPQDHALKLILADVLQDAGRTEDEAFWRWCAEVNLCPIQDSKNWWY